MLKNYLLGLFCCWCLVLYAQSQELSTEKHSGQLLDSKTNVPLPFAHIAVLGTNNGVVSNESGKFTITSTSLNKADTLSFYFVGYHTKKMSVKDFMAQPTVYLEAETYSLNEFFVFADNKNAEDIVKMVLKNKEVNYKNTAYTKSQMFTRYRRIDKIDNFNIQFKKSSLADLNEKMVRYIEQKIPKKTVSYTDYLSNFYRSISKRDTLKVEPIKLISLKDVSLSSNKEFEKIIEKIYKNINEKEYWKLKSGIVGTKIEYEDEEKQHKNDSLSEFYEDKMNNKGYATSMHKFFSRLFENKKKWEFLHHTNRYNYELVYGTQINGERVYVIDFTPKNSGKYIGKAYISTETYALVKADYQYAEGKVGKNIQLFGVGYAQNIFHCSIYFQKSKSNYQLKYYTVNKGARASFDRNISLIKKKERFLWDKKLSELKIKLNAVNREETLFELLMINSEETTPEVYKNYQQPPFVKTIYVNKFSDDLWKGYTIIEPSKQMREYKKIDQTK